tara:strand:+ start:234 stop:458 length:225 start_codon:yes stop_codon:yes gene_type:complete
MGNRTVEFKPGDLVTWYEAYADGYLTKDVGEGIIIEKRQHQLASTSGPYVTYKVYRTKYRDEMYFESREMEKIS